MSEPGSSAENYLEVYDDPLHRVQFCNEFALVYTVQIPRGAHTHWHRHTQDTVYFAIRDAQVQETLPGQQAHLTHAVCGTAVSRPHREKPLIHQVANVGEGLMHMVAAEAHARPPRVQTAALQARGHELAWESPRFRVYQVAGCEPGLEVDYPFYGLLVALEPATVDTRAAARAAWSSTPLEAGGWTWMEPPMRCHLDNRFRGILAEWR